jgi:phosphatidylglycerophosphate synthase
VSDFRLNRLFSRPLTGLLLRAPVTPNHVTTVSLALGLAGGWLFSQGTYAQTLAASFCYQLAVVLDNCDGEIARAKNLGSPFGAWYDIFADFVTDISLFAGLALGVLRAGVEGPVALFAMLCLSGGVMHLALVVIEKIRGFGPAAFAAPHPDHAHRRNPFLTVFDSLREGDASWFVVLFAAFGRPEWLLWAGGIYMQVLWLAAFALNFRWLFRETSR